MKNTETTKQDEYDYLTRIHPLMLRSLCSLNSCRLPAIQLDPHWPYETKENRCEKHKDSK